MPFSLYSRVGQPTVVYYFGLTFLKVALSCAVQRIVARRLEPSPATQSDEVKWKTFLASVDNDLNLDSELREAVRKVKQESVLHFDLAPIPGGRKMFI